MTFSQVIVFFPIAVLANWQIVETWRHGSIFDSVRDWLEERPANFFTDLLLCPFCLSHWTGALITASLFYSMDDLNYTYAQVVFIYALGVIRLPQVFNDLGYSYWRKHHVGLTAEQRKAQAELDKFANNEPINLESTEGRDNLAKIERDLDADVKA